MGTTEEEIRAKLEQDGHTVGHIEVEGEVIEVGVTKDGLEYEIELAADGTLIAFEQED